MSQQGVGTSPEEKRISNRRSKLQKVWSSKEWKEAKAKFLESHPLCAMCGEKAELAHHPYVESYKGAYTDLELSRCIPYCKRCHFAVHRGLKLCLRCHTRYCRWDSDICRHCWEKEHPEVKEQREAAKARWKRIQKEKRQKFRKKLSEKLGPKASRTKQVSLSQAPQKGRSGRSP